MLAVKIDGNEAIVDISTTSAATNSTAEVKLRGEAGYWKFAGYEHSSDYYLDPPKSR